MGDSSRNKDSATTSDTEALLARAKRIIQKPPVGSARTQAPEGNIAETITELNENLTFLRRCITSANVVASGLRSNVFAPIWRIVSPVAAFVTRLYLAVWNRLAYSTNRETGERTLSRTRSSVVVVATILFLSIFTNTQLGSAVRFVTVEPITDAILIALSKRTEIFYLTQSDEIDPENNIHSVRGCRKRGECAETDAAYFRVQPRLMHDLWKLIAYGNPVYVPDHIVAPIAPGVNECHVTYYGYRMTSSWIARILRSLQFYPTMLEAKCTYVGGYRGKE
jgi:hypothetical protein